MFRTLIYPSSGACDCAVELPHRSSVLGSLCVGDLVRLGLSGVRAAGFSLQHGHHSNPCQMYKIDSVRVCVNMYIHTCNMSYICIRHSG